MLYVLRFCLLVSAFTATELLTCSIVCLLVGLVLASLLTVMERKVLGSGQRRSGPS